MNLAIIETRFELIGDPWLYIFEYADSILYELEPEDKQPCHAH